MRCHPFGVPITHLARPTGVDTPACVVPPLWGLGHTHHVGICTPITVLGNPEGVTIAQARVQTRVYDVGTEQEPRRGDTCV